MDLSGYISIESFIAVVCLIGVVGFIAYRAYSIQKETKENPLIGFARATARNNARNKQIVAIHSNDGRVIMHEVDMSTWNGDGEPIQRYGNQEILHYMDHTTPRNGDIITYAAGGGGAGGVGGVGGSGNFQFTGYRVGDHATAENDMSAEDHAQQLGVPDMMEHAAVEPIPEPKPVHKNRFEMIIE